MGEGKKLVEGDTTTGRTFEMHSSISNGIYTGRPFCENCPTSHPHCEGMLCTDVLYTIANHDDSCTDTD